MIALALPGGGYGVFVDGEDAIDLVPGTPQPERPGNGPSVRLLDLGDVTNCSLGAHWPVPEEWLRREAPALHPGRGFTGRASQLRVAVRGTPTLTLSVSSEAGGVASELVTVPTSGYPPFTAILNVQLGPDAAAALRAAAAGEPGRAFVTIRATLPVDLPLVPQVLARTGLVVHPDHTLTATADLADWAAAPASITT